MSVHAPSFEPGLETTVKTEHNTPHLHHSERGLNCVCARVVLLVSLVHCNNNAVTDDLWVDNKLYRQQDMRLTWRKFL